MIAIAKAVRDFCFLGGSDWQYCLDRSLLSYPAVNIKKQMEIIKKPEVLQNHSY